MTDEKPAGGRRGWWTALAVGLAATIRTGPIRNRNSATDRISTKIGAENRPAAACATGRNPRAPK